MKILKIFGIAVAVHATVFMFVFATPGCRSTTRQSSPSAPRDQAAPVPPPAYPPATASAPTSPVQNTASPSVSGADLNPGVSGAAETAVYGSGPGIHFNPTRPGTPAANVLQTGPVSDVTPASTYTVVKGDSLSAVAKKNGISTSELVAANNLKKESVLRLGQKLIIPAKSAPSTAASTSTLGGGDTLTYEVKSGESLAVIAKRHGTTVTALRTLNKLTNDHVRVGQKILVPGAATATTNSAPVGDAEAAASAASKPTPPASTQGTKYTVKPGEGLGQIAKKFGVRLSDIAAANNISDPRKIRGGQEIIIPAANGKTPTAKATPAPAERTAPAAATPDTSAPAPQPVSPVGPGPAATEPNPVSAPPAGDAAPPVIKVDEGASPVGPAKS